MPLTDECRTCEYSKQCNRKDRAREGCVVRTIKNTRRETIEMKQLDAINMRIASVQTIDALKEQGLIYQGEDGELHVSERKNSTVPTDQS